MHALCKQHMEVALQVLTIYKITRDQLSSSILSMIYLYHHNTHPVYDGRYYNLLCQSINPLLISKSSTNYFFRRVYCIPVSKNVEICLFLLSRSSIHGYEEDMV